MRISGICLLCAGDNVEANLRFLFCSPAQAILRRRLRWTKWTNSTLQVCAIRVHRSTTSSFSKHFSRSTILIRFTEGKRSKKASRQETAKSHCNRIRKESTAKQLKTQLMSLPDPGVQLRSRISIAKRNLVEY